MEKAIYGLAAEFDDVVFKVKKDGITEYHHYEPDNVYYAHNIALTLSHEPKQTITTTKNQENGQLILVQKGYDLFFKFIPTTKHGERIFRYVKQRKLRQCSYIALLMGQTEDVEAYAKIGKFMDEKDKLLIKIPLFSEVCLTNTPANKNTFCTTDANDPRLEGIEWKTNIQHSDVDYWKEVVELAELDEQIEQLERDLERSRRKTKKLLKKRGILI